MGNTVSAAEMVANQLIKPSSQNDKVTYENTLFIQSKIDHNDIPSECPVHKSRASECPVQHEINPLNMMEPANQRPAPDQPFILPTERQTSSIPKAVVKEGESPFWQYPSQQVSKIHIMNEKTL